MDENISTDSEFEIKEEKPDHHFRTEIPNLLIDMIELEFLTLYDLTLYNVLKRVAGDSGRSWLSKKCLAKKCGFSIEKVRESLDNLSKVNPLTNTPLIKIINRIAENGSHATPLISIVNIWRKNGDFFRDKKDIKEIYTGSQQPPGGGSPQPPPGSQQLPRKEEPLKKNAFKEEKNNIVLSTRELGPPPSHPHFFSSFSEGEIKYIYKQLEKKGESRDKIAAALSFSLDNDFWRKTIKTVDGFLKNYFRICDYLPKEYKDMTEEEKFRYAIKQIHEDFPLAKGCLIVHAEERYIEENSYSRQYSMDMGVEEFYRRVMELYGKKKSFTIPEKAYG